MSNITLEDLKAEQTKLAEMIAKFESQATTTFFFPGSEIDLAAGEHYAGLIIGKDGNPSYHLVLLPGDIEANWEKSKAWAKYHGGELPNRREQSLLFANLKEQFKESYYWSSEQQAYNSHYAWYQYFGNGYQSGDIKNVELRARAVRRLEIESFCDC